MLRLTHFLVRWEHSWLSSSFLGSLVCFVMCILDIYTINYKYASTSTWYLLNNNCDMFKPFNHLTCYFSRGNSKNIKLVCSKIIKTQNWTVVPIFCLLCIGLKNSEIHIKMPHDFTWVIDVNILILSDKKGNRCL